MNEHTLRTMVVPLVYLLSASLFVVGLKRLSKVKTSRNGNIIASVAMLLAVVGTLLDMGRFDFEWLLLGTLLGALIGVAIATRVEMTAMPEMVALFNGFGGCSSALVALAVFWRDVLEPDRIDPSALRAGFVSDALGGAAGLVTVGASVLIGAVTLTGSLVAFLKLQGRLNRGAPILIPGRHLFTVVISLTAIASIVYLGFGAGHSGAAMNGALALTAMSLLLGVWVVIPIGGADMPVVVSLLNSYSGLAASAAGFAIGNPLLILSGALVGAAGLILTQIMCVAMNRSLLNVLVGGFGGEGASGGDNSEYENVTSAGPEEAAMILETAESVIIVPGYGLAVAQAQHTVRELASLLEKRGVQVRYAIHPVAGRMPGHMNVLLAEADVPYEQLVEMDAINSDFSATDVVIVLGANDVVNPAALDDEASPIYGMPILNAHEARTVFVVKRSLSPGYAGIKNGLFERPNTNMIFGDAKKVVQGLVDEVKQLDP